MHKADTKAEHLLVKSQDKNKKITCHFQHMTQVVPVIVFLSKITNPSAVTSITQSHTHNTPISIQEISTHICTILDSDIDSTCQRHIGVALSY